MARVTKHPNNNISDNNDRKGKIIRERAIEGERAQTSIAFISLFLFIFQSHSGSLALSRLEFHLATAVRAAYLCFRKERQRLSVNNRKK